MRRDWAGTSHLAKPRGLDSSLLFCEHEFIRLGLNGHARTLDSNISPGLGLRPYPRSLRTLFGARGNWPERILGPIRTQKLRPTPDVNLHRLLCDVAPVKILPQARLSLFLKTFCSHRIAQHLQNCPSERTWIVGV